MIGASVLVVRFVTSLGTPVEQPEPPQEVDMRLRLEEGGLKGGREDASGLRCCSAAPAASLHTETTPITVLVIVVVWRLSQLLYLKSGVYLSCVQSLFPAPHGPTPCSTSLMRQSVNKVLSKLEQARTRPRLEFSFSSLSIVLTSWTKIMNLSFPEVVVVWSST